MRGTTSAKDQQMELKPVSPTAKDPAQNGLVVTRDGTTWLEPVTDDQYKTAQAGLTG